MEDKDPRTEGWQEEGGPEEEVFSQTVEDRQERGPREVFSGDLYVGTKLIRAQPMDAMEFQIQHGDRGLADFENQPGYEVTYAGEQPSDPVYVSWSPKAVFENAYRKVTEAERKLF